MSDTTFTITATMGERWVPQFLGLLREMERCGGIGRSSLLAFYADGDGDFQPRFVIDGADPVSRVTPADPVRYTATSVGHYDAMFDAG